MYYGQEHSLFSKTDKRFHRRSGSFGGAEVCRYHLGVSIGGGAVSQASTVGTEVLTGHGRWRFRL